MRVRTTAVLAVLALLGLPACFDPIVGGECKPGYSPCHNACMPSGTCRVLDASGEAGPALDGSASEAGIALDVGDIDGDGTGVDADPVDQDETAIDAESADGAATEDLASGEAGTRDATKNDTPRVPDAPYADLGKDLPKVPDVPNTAEVRDGADARDGTDARDAVDAQDMADAQNVADARDAADVVDAPLRDDLPGNLDTGAMDTGPILVLDVGANLDGTTLDGDAPDGGTLDGEDTGEDTGDGALDVDARDDLADGGDAAADDSAGASLDAGVIDSDPDGLVCTAPLVICNNDCVDLSFDPENCGHCNNICDQSGVCNSGTCLVCAAGETPCGRQCQNLAIDPDNCGGCGVPCTNGLCSNGLCEAAGTGRVIVIGHDYFKNRSTMNRILGNAVFLWPVNPVQLLTYQGAADSTAIEGAKAAIKQVADDTGRQYNLTVALASEVPTALAAADVLLIYGQQGASDATLVQLGQDWKAVLTLFLRAGGTVIVLDAFYAPTNAGTVQILSSAGLFGLARGTLETDQTCTVVARGDALATGLSPTYRCEKNSTSFTISDTATTITPVVAVGTHTVVVHKIF
jgi:hypothetical protein